MSEPGEKKGGGDDFLPIDFHENLDDEGNYVGAPFGEDSIADEDANTDDVEEMTDEELGILPPAVKSFRNKG